jgi:hypothetical protein
MRHCINAVVVPRKRLYPPPALTAAFISTSSVWLANADVTRLKKITARNIKYHRLAFTTLKICRATDAPTPSATPTNANTDTSLERWTGPNFNNPR